MYNYHEEMRCDIYEHVKESVEFEKDNNPEVSQEDVFETLYDEMFISDEVTGNGSKDGYPLTQDEIGECLNGNVKLLLDAMRDLECDITSVGKGFTEYGLKYFDTIIRCFILDEVLNEVIKELWY